MYAIDVVKEAANNSGVSLASIGRALGVADNYIAKSANRGSTPQCDTMARMLDACGYGLYAIPYEQAPKNALQITGDDNV